MHCTKQEMKALDARVHAQFFDYLRLFKLIHPTTKEFDAIFKPDMFVKNNKAAFQHVIYYLLTVLNPAAIKKKVSNWPILDMKMEAQFRREIMNYINELKTLYPDFEIPTIVASHLINPGGIKFVNIMLDIVQLVASQILERQGYESPMMPRCDPNHKEQSKLVSQHFAQSTKHLHNEISHKVQAHLKRQTDQQFEAGKLDNEILESKKNIIKLQEILAQEQLDHNTDDINQNIDELETEMLEITGLQAKFNHCLSRLNYFMGDDCFLETKAASNEVNASWSAAKHLDTFYKKFCVAKIFDTCRVEGSVVESKQEILGRVLHQYRQLQLELPLVASRQEGFASELMGAPKPSIERIEEESESATMVDSQRTPGQY